jgi:predicted nucleic acid-binding protein
MGSQQRGISFHGLKTRQMNSTNVSFADAYLAALAEQHGIPVASFDRDFDKFKEITRFDPASQQKPAD